MTSLRTRQLLSTAARIKKDEAQSLSRDEISKKIDEIKYLSSKKNVPKLSLRKEILHLEKQLGSLFNIEKKLLRKEEHESIRVSNLKRQVTLLKTKIEKSSNPDIEEKIEKLTMILGELLAKSDTADNIRLKAKLDETLHLEKGKWERQKQMQDNSKLNSYGSNELSPAKKARALNLIKKTTQLRELLENKANIAKNNGNDKLLEKLKQDIFLLEKKLDQLKQDFPQLKKEIALELEKEKAFAKSIGAQIIPSQISPIRSHLESSTATPADTSAPQVKHNMMMVHPNINGNQEDITSESALPRDNQGVLQNQGQNLEESMQEANSEQISQFANQMNGPQTAQMGTIDQADINEQELNDELIAELPLPPPPRIKRR
ncbi:hypothetical protein HOC01_00215 [archaeon]|jgi:hypothetical protein|nr:hypothetical protein [archaeon]MBT6698737.1 hypothetical protein [archaeon]